MLCVAFNLFLIHKKFKVMARRIAFQKKIEKNASSRLNDPISEVETFWACEGCWNRFLSKRKRNSKYLFQMRGI